MNTEKRTYRKFFPSRICGMNVIFIASGKISFSDEDEVFDDCCFYQIIERTKKDEGSFNSKT